MKYLFIIYAIIFCSCVHNSEDSPVWRFAEHSAYTKFCHQSAPQKTSSLKVHSHKSVGVNVIDAFNLDSSMLERRLHFFAYENFQDSICDLLIQRFYEVADTSKFIIENKFRLSNEPCGLCYFVIYRDTISIENDAVDTVLLKSAIDIDFECRPNLENYAGTYVGVSQGKDDTIKVEGGMVYGLGDFMPIKIIDKNCGRTIASPLTLKGSGEKIHLDFPSIYFENDTCVIHIPSTPHGSIKSIKIK